jgi:hypothetical protein
MKRWGLLVITPITVLLTGVVLHKAGWFSHRASAAGPAVRTVPRDSHSSAVLRQAHGQPHHWRDCLLAH